MRVDELLEFAVERQMTYLRREEDRRAVAAGETPQGPPWTEDPILAQYRFCNIYREQDTVTNWLREEWREPHADDPDLWFAFVVARHMNNVSLLGALGGPPLPWDAERFKAVCLREQEAGRRVFSAAYMIATRHHGPKADYLADEIFQPLWDARDRLRPQPGDTLTGFHMSLGVFYGLASFLSAQVVADVKYVEPLLSAPDWHIFAASGPGSRRGLNRLLGRDKNARMTEDEFRLRLRDLREAMLPRFRELGWEEPHGQDVQNMLCEHDKYERVRLGEGRPKQLFRAEL